MQALEKFSKAGSMHVLDNSKKHTEGLASLDCCYKFITVASILTGENKETTSVQNCSHSGG